MGKADLERSAQATERLGRPETGGVDRDALTRNDERFGVLLAGKQPYGWQLEGPDYELMARSPRGLYD